MLELKKKTEAEIDKKKEKIKEYSEEEENSLEKIQNLTDEVTTLSTEMEEYSKSSSKLKKLNTFLIRLNTKLSSCKKEHQFFEDNHVCPTCTQDLSDEFRSDKIEEGKTKLDEMNVGYEELQTAIKEEEERSEKFIELSQDVNTNNTTITNINYQLMSIRNNIDEINKEIKELEGSTPDKKAEFVKLEELLVEKKETKKTYTTSKKDRDVLQVATTLLKDSGIKTRIIKTYLPTMNKLINQFLQSMDFYVNFTLNEHFEETIKSRYRDVFSYESFSEGEKARIDISLLLTWRSIAKLKNSVDTNLLILDEIFDGSLDQSGTSDLGWILRNFDDSTNVFVISHKTILDDKFDRTITVNKDKNYSTLEETVHEVTHALVG